MAVGSNTPDAGGPCGAFVPCGCASEASFEWLCVNTGWGQEAMADRHVRELGLCSWLPKHWVGKRVWPLFPCYLFVQADLGADLWRGIYRLRGVVTILGTRFERPARVPEAALRVLWAEAGPDGVSQRPDRAAAGALAPLDAGVAVSVVAGPFAGLSGICQRSTAERVTLLMSILGGSPVATLPRRDVAPAE